MPGFTTHYLFGQQTYQQLRPSHLKHMIQTYPKVFAFGLQGPDFFFYDALSFLRKGPQPGSVAHSINPNDFLNALLKSPALFLTKKEQHIAQTYALGFVGHYLLDTACHPYIYARSSSFQPSINNLSHHICLEIDIDTTLLWYFHHKHPSEFHSFQSIAISAEQMQTIATALQSAFSHVHTQLSLSRHNILRAMKSMQWGTRFLYDPLGYKKALLHRIEIAAIGYPLVSALIPKDMLLLHKDPCNTVHHLWQNPDYKSHTSLESFLDLFEKAKQRYLQQLYQLAAHPISKSFLISCIFFLSNV